MPPVSALGTDRPPSETPSSPPSYEELFSHPSEEEDEIEAKDEDTDGDLLEEEVAEDPAAGHSAEESRVVALDGRPTGTETPADPVPAAFVALDDAIAALDNQPSAPTAATRSTQRSAEHGTDEEEDTDDEERGGHESGGERPPSRSPTRREVVWESINPFDHANATDNSNSNNRNNNTNTTTNNSTVQSASARSSSTSRTAARRSSPKLYQPSTFKELMTGIKETLVAEEEMAGAGWDDDDAESRYHGGEQEPDEGNGRVNGGARRPAATSSAVTNIRKLAEAESIWGTAPAAGDDADEEASARRKVSGRYLRNNVQFRPQSLQPPPPQQQQQQARGRQGKRSEDRPVSTERYQRSTIAPAGEALGRPSAVFDQPGDARPTAAAGGRLEKAGNAEKGAAASKPGKRGKSIGKKISRIFGRKTEVK